MKKIISIFLSLFFSVLIIGDSLNLVQIQKREKERRKRIGKSKYVLTNSSIIKYALKKNKSFVKSDKKLNEPAKEKKEPIEKSKKRGEEYWRGRLNAINASIEQLKKKIVITQSTLNKASSDYIIASMPSRQNQLREKVNKLSKEIAKLRANLKFQESKKEDFFDEARKNGALPGWLR